MDWMFADLAGIVAGSGLTLTIGTWIFTTVVHVAFCVGVYGDAARRRETVFVGPGIWAFATLLGGVFTAAAYWVLHHSTLQAGLDSPAGD